MRSDQKLMNVAKRMASLSQDKSTKTGAAIFDSADNLVALACNAFPHCVDETVAARHERAAKYKWTEHAERNAIYNAARWGHSLLGTTMYLTWYPCMDCARAIIQSGITSLVCYEPNWNDPRWGAYFADVPVMLEEGGVNVTFLS